MGQGGISMLSKVGYSMFWNSMWDNKISYSRLFKEDIFLNKFFSLAFSDGLSINTFSYKKKSMKNNNKYKHFIDRKNFSLKNYLNNINKVNFYSSKLWILRYQKWVIIYNFIYINEYNKNSKKLAKAVPNIYKDNFFYLYKNYLKSFNKINLNYKLFKKKTTPNYF